ncbi:AAA family ATPase [Flavobacterium ustbae]|uniref:AAA family ATPase n=1 Tax=Flavobacterium ustbae TaxID=2488790 RepID=UPI000F77B31B|nr:AAA family ATPase [Flavobacterium ustbae]
MKQENRFKISQLKIKNFKCIDKIEFSFDSNNLIVFDGPNGYGKTTVFEAIEILFTGKPRRFRDVNLDARYTFLDSPIHKSNDLEVELELIVNDGSEIEHSIKRIFPKSIGKSKLNNISQIFNESTLLINNRISTYEDLEQTLDFSDLYKLYSVLNYVEQDENTYFLKKDPKDRYDSFLVSLLGGEEERNELAKIKFCSTEILKRKKQHKERIDEIERSNTDFSSIDSTLSYKHLITDKDFEWDKSEIKNTVLNVNISYLIEIEKIKSLLENKSILKDIELVSKLNNFSNLAFAEEFSNNYWSLENFQFLENEYSLRNSNDRKIRNNKSKIEDIEKQSFSDLSDESFKEFLQEKENLKIDINAFDVKTRLVKSLQESLSLQNNILSNFKDRRQDLIDFNNQHKDHINLSDGECPTCGFDWKNNEKLIEQINATEKKIFSDYLVNNKSFEEQKELLINEYLNPIKDFLRKEIDSFDEENKKLIENGKFLELKEKFQNLKSRFDHFLELFESRKRDELISLVNNRVIENINEITKKVYDFTNDYKPKISEQIDINSILSDFENYFNKSFELLEQLTEQDILDKKKYIEIQYLKAIDSELQNFKEKYSRLKVVEDKLNSIIKVYDQKIKDYTEEIINKISIPFHIYTGKILQNHSLGSGLSIEFETGKQKQVYIRPTCKDQEVAYLLSSGQLSATVISLMLVLNKVFNQSKLGTILIDDPLQTLDEINTHSLVELLKYNFNDQQLILSTHEDRYSKFIRYKYDRFGLSGKSINMKNRI